MTETTDWGPRLQRLRESDTDIDRMMTFYEKAAAIHDAARAAMGQGSTRRKSSVASTNVPIAPGMDIRKIPLADQRRGR